MVDECNFLLPDIPIISSDFWQSEDECTLDLLRHVFRSTTDEEIPLLEERLACLREAGQVLYKVMPITFLCVYMRRRMECCHTLGCMS